MTDTRTANKPTHDICFVEDRKDKKGHWVTIGAGWAHKDGGGLNFQLDYIPLDLAKGRFVIRVRSEKADGEVAQ